MAHKNISLRRSTGNTKFIIKRQNPRKTFGDFACAINLNGRGDAKIKNRLFARAAKRRERTEVKSDNDDVFAFELFFNVRGEIIVGDEHVDIVGRGEGVGHDLADL